MKERIVFECVGQGGGNVGELLAKRDYLTHFVNASNTDLDTIDVEDSLKYHIPNAFGSNGKREKAMGFAKRHHEHMLYTLDSKFPKQDIVYFVFTAGGGSGGGISPLMINFSAERNPQKKYGAIVMLAALDEHKNALKNTLETIRQLKMIPKLRSIFILDNSTGDMFDINKTFVEDFDTLINITKPHKKGIIDGAELEELITCKGVSFMGKFDTADNEIKFNNQIYANYTKGCQYIGLSLKDENIPKNIMDEKFGIPDNRFVGYNENSNFMIATGLKLYTPRFDEISKRIESLESQKASDDAIDDFDIPIIKKDKPSVEEPKKSKVDFDDMFSKFIE